MKAGIFSLLLGFLPFAAHRFRLTLARYLALATEFQLAAHILSTAIAPSWHQIGKLGAIIAIPTGLNYCLKREMKEVRVQMAGPGQVP